MAEHARHARQALGAVSPECGGVQLAIHVGEPRAVLLPQRGDSLRIQPVAILQPSATFVRADAIAVVLVNELDPSTRCGVVARKQALVPVERVSAPRYEHTSVSPARVGIELAAVGVGVRCEVGELTRRGLRVREVAQPFVEERGHVHVEAGG